MDKSVAVKMVLLIFRDSIEEDIVSLLKQSGVKASGGRNLNGTVCQNAGRYAGRQRASARS